MEKNIQILTDCKVKMHFSLCLVDGPEAISTFAEDPIEFVMGDGTLDPGLENCLYGMYSGDEQSIRLMPGQAYGDRDIEMIQNLLLADFPEEIKPTPGLVISFSSPGDEETLGVILEIEQDSVVVDFNHPLAGRELDFKMQILDVHAPLQ